MKLFSHYTWSYLLLQHHTSIYPSENRTFGDNLGFTSLSPNQQSHNSEGKSHPFLLHQLLSKEIHRLVAWHSGRTSVFGRQTFHVLCSNCSWWVTNYVGKPSATGQPTKPTKPTQPFILLRSINWLVSCNRMFASSHEWRRLVNAYKAEARCGWLERWCVC